MTTIRHATEDDVLPLLRMAGDFVLSTGYAGKVRLDAEAILSTIEQLRRNGLALVADHDGEPVGMLGATVYRHPLTAERTASEIAWWVNPEHRTLTLAREMVRQYEAWAIGEQGATVVQLVEPAGSLVSLLYRRLHRENRYQPLETTWQRRVA